MSYNLKQYIGASLIALASFGAWVFLAPQSSGISRLRAAVSERQNLLQARKDIVAKVASLNAEYKKKSSDIARLSAIVPVKKSVPEIVSATEHIATQSGIQLVGISVADDKSAADSNYKTLVIDMSLSGSYLSLISFLDAAERNLRLIDVISIEATQSPGLGSQNNIGFKMSAHVYYLSR